MITLTSFYVKPFEIDKMNIVYHAFYARWFERGRLDYFKKAGIPNLSISRQGFYLPLSEIHCRYKSPAKYGDEISIFTQVTYMSCVKLKFEYKVFNKKTGKILAVGDTVHAWTDKNIMPLNIEKAAPQIYSLLKSFAEKPSGIEEEEVVSYNDQ